MPHGLVDDRTRLDDTASVGTPEVLFVQGVSGRSPTDTVHLHHGEIWGGDFRLGPLLGRGGMGAVYKGRQLSLDRPVAIKALKSHLSDNADLTARFEQEAKVVARISSPHVVHVHVFGKHRNHHFLAMELVEGEDLNKKLKSGWRPAPAETLDLMIQAAKGLMAAAERGIVHRDIKPGNMMLTTNGLLKLMDFGLARLAHHVGSATSTGVVMGTGAYMSPEQCQGRICDTRSDIYSLGVVFYELLTGRRPFDGETYMEMFCQHIEKDPTPPRDLDAAIPEEYQTVVMTCLAKKSEERYQ
ncbi:MAG: serine/threonine protein kinase, partial [Planctomycetes bacterium]|nr:serine/threonine protein kinase [Planctomycetota bacterium]